MFKKIFSGLEYFIADKNKKNILKILKEFFHLWVIQKHIPIHYFSRFLYRKEFIHYKDYMSTAQYFRLIYSEKIQNHFFVEILQNKFFFSLFCERNSLPVPKVVSYNSCDNFYYLNTRHVVKSNQDLINYFKTIFSQSKISKLIIKSLNTKGGKGIFFIEEEFLESSIKSFGPEILSSSFIHQTCIEQHVGINEIYANSINTLRFDICVDNKGKSHLLGTVMRFGKGGSVIDNRSKGGFFVSIDDETGCLMKKGYQQMGFSGKEFCKHPDTGFVFEGYKIPYYKESKELAYNMSSILPNKLVGWDIAITPDGPLVIEGNHDSNITMSEVAYGGYLKHPVIKELLNDC